MYRRTPIPKCDHIFATHFPKKTTGGLLLERMGNVQRVYCFHKRLETAIIPKILVLM